MTQVDRKAHGKGIRNGITQYLIHAMVTEAVERTAAATIDSDPPTFPF
ncbi:hypothetical protein [Alicyclobacillus cellulosilyticus]|nr:hypothetical protein [Alicyclobacillus cellulosilyticus]